jgi:AAA+ ATPase superfamily predicted ATPase
MDLKVGKPVTGDELVGRTKEVNEILMTLKAGQSVVLIAPRRFGKTSLMMEVLNRLTREGFYTGHIDLFTIPDIERLAYDITGQVLKNRRLDESLDRLRKNIGEILTNIKFRKEIEGQELILSFGKPQRDPWEQLKSSVGFIDTFAVKHKKKMCFAFDEFGDIDKLDGIEIIKLFRGIIQSQKQAVFLFSGSYESVMNKLFVSSKSPFYRMVKIIQPGYIEKVSLMRFIVKKFKELDTPFNEDDVRRAVDFTRGHPYYIRLFIQEYWFRYLQDKKVPETEEIINIMLLSENSYLEKQWDEISGKRETRIVFIKVVETGKPYTGMETRSINVSRAVNELIGKGILMPEGQGYCVTDPLLERFVRERILKIDDPHSSSS